MIVRVPLRDSRDPLCGMALRPRSMNPRKIRQEDLYAL